MNNETDKFLPCWIIPTSIPPYAIDIKRMPMYYGFRKENNTPEYYWKYRTSPHTKHFECVLESYWYYERYMPPF